MIPLNIIDVLILAVFVLVILYILVLAGFLPWFWQHPPLVHILIIAAVFLLLIWVICRLKIERRSK